MDINELKIRSNSFVTNINIFISEVVDHNKKLLDLNRAQLRRSKTAKGSQLINSRTGSKEYSKAYARYKGYRMPDLFDKGDFYRAMDIMFMQPSEYLIDSDVEHTKYLIEMYGEDIFGITNEIKAQNITTAELQRIYRREVI